MNRVSTYADYNAQAPLRPEARAAVERVMSAAGNPSSVHAAGRKAKAVLDEARDIIAASVGGKANDVVFTSGAAEANTLAIHSAINAGGVDLIFLSALEHESVWKAAHASGKRTQIVPVNSDGRVDLDWLAGRLQDWNAAQDGRPLVCVMLANNETGIIQPVQAASDIVHGAYGYLLCDAVQGLGRIDIDIENLGADYLSLSAHKIGGLAGAGALMVRGNTPIAALIHGGGQEQGRRAGTENLAGAAAFGAACAALKTNIAEAQNIRAVRDAFENALRAHVSDVCILGEASDRVGNTSCVAMPGASAATIVVAMDMAGIACSAGSACSSGKVQTSRGLPAMGLDDSAAQSAVRFSFGWNSKAEDGVAAANAYIEIIGRLRSQRAA